MRWAGIFRGFAARFAQTWARKPDAARSKTDFFEGYIAKHSLVSGRITTRVIDPPGYLLGFPDGVAEALFIDPLPASLLWPTYARDVFAPGVPIPDDLAPKPDDPSQVTFQYPTSLYGASSLINGKPWSNGPWWFSAGAPTDDSGIAGGTVICNTPYPSQGADRATVLDSVRLAAYIQWYASRRGVVRPTDMLGLYIYEDGLQASMPGYTFAPRMYPTTAVGGSNRPITVRMARQIAMPAAARAGGRCAAAMGVTTSPERTTFELGCGLTGVYMPIVATAGLQLIDDIRDVTTDDILPGSATVGQWTADTPWVQEFAKEEPVQWYNPATDETETIVVEVKHVVTYPPGGTYLYGGRTSGNPEDPLQLPIQLRDYMTNDVGVPAIALMDDRLDVVVAYRAATPWIDERDTDGTGIDIYPELTPVTTQMRTGLVVMSMTYTTSVSEEGDLVTTVGDPVLDHVRQDVSGAVENCFEALGGDREDFHRLYRVRWAGNVGGKSVALVSIVKHKRWEEPATGKIPADGPIIPALPAAQVLLTAQSGINNGHSVDWRYTYTAPDGEEVYGERNWNLGACVRIPGDDDDEDWLSTIGVGVLVDGVLTELEALDLGWSLIRSPTRARLREDDWRWESTTANIGTVVSDDSLVFAAYALPEIEGEPVRVKLLRLDVDGLDFTELRDDALPTNGSRPAVSCYQHHVAQEGADDVLPCLIYRLGHQTAGGWAELSKDGGSTWRRIWEGPTSPGRGFMYIGSQLWAPEYTDTFKNYR
ncbi:hypothetical protein ACNFCJ_08015 [Pseudomonas sp. NY15364]|uniref:hypothetical protein n=1 Tax=Pseudomonas sp. NY15364 TaxID=3400353 RepID=UPI003A8514B0